jgi:hypothetical protein
MQREGKSGKRGGNHHVSTEPRKRYKILLLDGILNIGVSNRKK